VVHDVTDKPYRIDIYDGSLDKLLASKFKKEIGKQALFTRTEQDTALTITFYEPLLNDKLTSWKKIIFGEGNSDIIVKK
jgi:hypothetical protein